MNETKRGQGKLSAYPLDGGGETAVEFAIHFTDTIKPCRVNATVEFVKRVDELDIPEGEYELLMDDGESVQLTCTSIGWELVASNRHIGEI